MKKYFITGLVTIMPLLITFYIIKFMLNFLTKPFIGFISPIFSLFYSQLLILGILFLLIVLVGYLGQWLIVNAAFIFFESMIHKIPLINKIYKPVQDMLYTLFSDTGPNLSKPIQIPFPHAKSQVIAFISNENVALPGKCGNKLYSAVYLPSPPNPMLGFLILMPKDHISQTTLPVEQSIQFIASCGIIKFR